MPAEVELHIQRLHNELSLKDDRHFRSQLEYLINQLIEKDFNKLVQILYRIDVNEAKLKDLLNKYHGTDAAIIISGVIIEREVQKIKWRKQNHSNKDIPDEEIW